MDPIAIISFLIGLIEKLIGTLTNRPRLKIEITSFIPDSENNRWIIRAKVINVGKIEAKKCEGFWSIFDANFREVESGVSVFWSLESDDDYNYKDYDRRTKDLEYYDRAYCWAEIEINRNPVEGTNYYLFPYNLEPKKFYLTIILEYGQFKSFEFLEIAIISRISHSDDFETVNNNINISWPPRWSLCTLKKRCSLTRVIKTYDYHEHIRPT